MLRVALLLVLGCGGSGYPTEATITVQSPADGAVIGSHGRLPINTSVAGGRVRELKLAVDGVIDDTVDVREPTERGCDPCTYSLVWDTTPIDEGPVIVTILAYGDSDDPIGETELSLVFDDVPEILYPSPLRDMSYPGVGTLGVSMSVHERGPTTARIELDGVVVVMQQHPHCKGGCRLSTQWDTRTLPAGRHEILFAASDAMGHVVEERRLVGFDDMMTLTGIEVTNLPGLLELEVFVFDDTTSALLGCIGSMQGLDVVNSDDTFYPLSIPLETPFGEVVGMAAAAGHPIRVEVWEDDDPPVCPTVPNPGGNNLVGTSPAFTAEEWKANNPISFGDVTRLQLGVGRPRTR